MINYIEIKSGKYILRGLHTKAENEKGLVCNPLNIYFPLFISI